MNWEQTWNKVKNSTVALTNLEGRIIGTGFFITKYGHLLTCAHVVEEADGWENILIKEQREQIVEKVYLGNSNEDDIAVLKIENYQGDEVPLSLNPKLSGKFYTFSYSRSDFANGSTISGEITDTSCHINYGNLPMLRLTAPIDAQKIEGGCSGAPVFDLNSEGVVGVISAHDREQGALAIPLDTVCQKWIFLKNYLDPNWQKKEKLAAELHNVIRSHYLVDLYNQQRSLKSHSYEDYFQFFHIVSEIKTKSLDDSLFKDLNKFIDKNKKTISLWVQGLPGTGKSSFLSIVYWYFYELYHNCQNAFLPVFINLHRYSRLIKNEASKKLLQKDHTWLISQIDCHLNPLDELIKLYPNQQFLVIIDGYDRYSELEEEIFRYLIEKYTNHTYIIGSVRKYDVNVPIPNSPRNHRSFSSLKTEDSNAVYQFIEAFLKIALPAFSYAEEIQFLLDVIKQYKLEEIDLFTLCLLKCRTPKDCCNLPPLSAILHRYCQDYLTKINKHMLDRAYDLDYVAQVAFHHEVIKKPLNDDDTVFLELVYCHPKVCEYLIAYQMIKELKSLNTLNSKSHEDINRAIDILRCIQSNQVNRLCKEIINNNQLPEQIGFINAIDKLLSLDNVHYHAKAFACYLAGRFEHVQAKTKAYDVLKKFVEQTLKDDNSDDYLFLSRSAYVSLAYTQSYIKSNLQKDYLRTYVNKLLSDPKVDEVNRGFHLQYYGDKDFFAPLNLICKDDLGSFTKTFKELSHSLRNKNKNPLFEIQLHTLCSLAQHRHAEGKLQSHLRNEIRNILTEIIDNNKIKNNKLRTYVCMVHKHLKYEKFCVGRIFDDYYKLKIAKRTGWVKRGIINGESVADHVYGAYLIALFLLPDFWKTEPEEEKYDKREIIDMLLIHDLAEAKVHDIPTFLKNNDHEEKEREVFDEIEMLGTYKELPKLDYIKVLHRKFETRNTFNARVAKEIDILENWTQLQIYKAKGYEINDYDKWSQELHGKIKTDLGHLIKEKLEVAYLDLEKVGKVYEVYLEEEQKLIDD